MLWIASHCWTDSRREEYIKELSKFIPVTVVGKCAKVQLSKSKKLSIEYVNLFSWVLQVLGQTSSEEDDLGKFYFYLAFENSICNDYVTEKFFRGLQVTIKNI